MTCVDYSILVYALNEPAMYLSISSQVKKMFKLSSEAVVDDDIRRKPKVCLQFCAFFIENFVFSGNIYDSNEATSVLQDSREMVGRI